MARSLIIVESPAKARTLQRYLGKSFTVKASVGHIRDLPVSTLGVDTEKDFSCFFTKHLVLITEHCFYAADIRGSERIGNEPQSYFVDNWNTGGLEY